jgi:hypothetical protein
MPIYKGISSGGVGLFDLTINPTIPTFWGCTSHSLVGSLVGTSCFGGVSDNGLYGLDK